MQLFRFMAALFGVALPAHADGFFNPVTAHNMVEKQEAVLVDVREEDEVGSGMAKGALLLPTSKIKANAPDLQKFINGLDSKKTVIVYCKSGRRSAYFMELLRKRGYKAENLGGFEDWQKAGLPTAHPLKARQ